MKRIYLLLATIAVFLMTGCSNDEVGPDPANGEKAILFSIGAYDGITSKAATDPLPGEDVIKNLTVLLFDHTTKAYVDGKYQSFTGGTPGIASIEDWEIDGGVFDILLIANSTVDYTTPTNKPADLDAIQTAVDDIFTQKQDNLLMVSKLYENVAINYLTDDGGVSARRTYYYMLQVPTFAEDVTAFTKKQAIESIYSGSNEPVLLTRQAARIQLESLAVDFTENLTGATFRLDKVYLVNARPGTMLWSATGKYEATPTANPLYYRGAPASFEMINGFIAPAPVSTVPTGDNATYFVEAYTNTTITNDEALEFVTDESLTMFQTYAFENHSPYTAFADDALQTPVVKDPALYDTRLVIEGEIIRAGQTEGLGKSYYHIPIKKDDTNLLVRNHVYSINVTITSYGHNNPDGSTTTDPENPGEEIIVPFNPENNALCNFTVTVAPWKVIKQVEEDDSEEEEEP